jgi:hypothetical protein
MRVGRTVWRESRRRMVVVVRRVIARVVTIGRSRWSRWR